MGRRNRLVYLLRGILLLPIVVPAPWWRALERPEMISAAQAIKAYPLLVKPFIVALGTNAFAWLHPAGVSESANGKRA